MRNNTGHFQHLCLSLITLSVLLLFTSPVFANSNKTLHFTAGHWPPYFSESMPGKGIVGQIVTEAYALEGYDVEMSFFPWARAYALAQSGEYDGSLVWQKVKKREHDFVFSSPVVWTKVVLFHRKDRPFNWNVLGDLKELRIGTTRGYAYSPDFRQSAKRHKLTVIDSDSDLINMKLLMEGRIDIHPNNRLVGEYLLDTHFPVAKRERIVSHPKPLAVKPLSIIYPKKNTGSEKLLSIFERGLEKLKESGRYDDLLNFSHSDEKTLIIGVTHTHGSSSLTCENGTYHGMDRGLLDEISNKTGVTFEPVSCPWSRCLELLKSGDVDMLTSLTKTPEREEFAWFLGHPYAEQKVFFFKRKNSDVAMDSYDDLVQYTVGVNAGSNYFAQFDHDTRITKVPVAMYYQLPHMLSKGRVDIIVGWEGPMSQVIESEGLNGEIEQLPYSVVGGASYLAFSKKSRSVHLRAIVEKALDDVKNSGRAMEIMKSNLLGSDG